MGCTTNLTNGEFCLDITQSEEALQAYNILKDRILLERWSIKSYKENQGGYRNVKFVVHPFDARRLLHCLVLK